MRPTFATMLKQVEPRVESPEDLLRMMDAQIAGARAQRTGSASQRAAIAVGGILLLLMAAAGALMYLFTYLNDNLRHDGAPVTPPPTEEAGATPGRH